MKVLLLYLSARTCGTSIQSITLQLVAIISHLIIIHTDQSVLTYIAANVSVCYSWSHVDADVHQAIQHNTTNRHKVVEVGADQLDNSEVKQ